MEQAKQAEKERLDADEEALMRDAATHGTAELFLEAYGLEI